MKLKLLVFCFLALSFVNLGAQDFHNSFIQFAPLNINPALTGAFYGNLRANIIARDQGRPVAGGGNEFQDLSLSLDGSIDFGLTKNDWVSAGMSFARSTSGVLSFRRQFTGLNLAYHLSFGKKSDKVFTLGVRYGNYSTGFNGFGGTTTKLLADPMGQDFDLLGIQVTDSEGNLPQKSSSDYMVGMMLTTPVGKKSDIRIGISADHLFTPRLSFPDSGMDTIPGPGPIQDEELLRRVNGFIYYYTSISDRLVFNPNILYQKIGVSTNILFQGLVNYLIDPKKDITLIAGLGVRLVNSTDIPVYLGADIKSWRVGISYDTNIAGLRPSNGTFGALEIGISKIFSWFKPTTVKPVYICPRL